MNIANFNFKRAFLILFAAFLLFSAVSFAFAASGGGWSEAVQSEQNRLETRVHLRGHSAHHHRAAHLNSAEASGTSSETITLTRSSDNRLLGGLARTYVRVTSDDFGVFHVFHFLFRAVFTFLLALWVYVDSKKYGRNTILWTAITAVTSIFGFLVYLIVHRVRKAPAASA